MKPAIFSILSTSICFIPVCMCRLRHVFLCHLYSLFGGWLSKGYFSGKYVKKNRGDGGEREKGKNKSSSLVVNAIPPAYVIYKHCFVITFFFLMSVPFYSFLAPVFCGTIVTWRWERRCRVVLSLARTHECIRSLKLFFCFFRNTSRHLDTASVVPFVYSAPCLVSASSDEKKEKGKKKGKRGEEKDLYS